MRGEISSNQVSDVIERLQETPETHRDGEGQMWGQIYERPCLSAPSRAPGLLNRPPKPKETRMIQNVLAISPLHIYSHTKKTTEKDDPRASEYHHTPLRHAPRSHSRMERHEG
ncbi:unnamed protein product [Leuciscus chuanchicus]